MEKSIFDIEVQNTHLDSKIIVALERISEVFRVLLWQEGKELGLSPIQIQLLIFIALHEAKYCKVSYLAQEFQVSKPTISDAVKVLEQKGLIEKIADTNDTRSYHIILSAKGREITPKLALFSNTIQSALAPMPTNQKNELWQSLLSIMVFLQKSELVSLQRMCFNCANYQNRQGLHFCNMLQTNLQNEDIRIDCNEHQSL